jgi:hypothetical protein
MLAEWICNVRIKLWDRKTKSLSASMTCRHLGPESIEKEIGQLLQVRPKDINDEIGQLNFFIYAPGRVNRSYNLSSAAIRVLVSGLKVAAKHCATSEAAIGFVVGY